MKTTIYLTRHGETQWNINKRFQGWADSPLTELGVKQAEALKGRLEDINVDVIYTSPIGRANDTANILKGNKNIEVVTHDGLKEFNFGIWEGMTTVELENHEEYKDEFYNLFNNPKEYKPFGGETLKEVKLRAYSAIDEIVRNNEGKDVLIVTHGMTIKLLMLLFENSGEEESFSTTVMGQASLTKIEVENGEFSVIYKDDKGHYGEGYVTKGW
ncbi:MAG: histidine phosphatase family protein [Clostridium sp.]